LKTGYINRSRTNNRWKSAARAEVRFSAQVSRATGESHSLQAFGHFGPYHLFIGRGGSGRIKSNQVELCARKQPKTIGFRAV